MRFHATINMERLISSASKELPQPFEREAEVVADGAALALDMADHRLDGGPVLVRGRYAVLPA